MTTPVDQVVPAPIDHHGRCALRTLAVPDAAPCTCAQHGWDVQVAAERRMAFALYRELFGL